MKNKGKCFSKKLFFEGIRQTKWIGIAAVVGYMFALFGEWIAYTGMELRAITSSAVSYVKPYGFVSESPMLLYCLIVPIMMWRLLGFLNKRNASDFYHAIPMQREKVYRTYCLVVLTWAAFLALIYVGLATFLQMEFAANASGYLDAVMKEGAVTLAWPWTDMLYKWLYGMAGCVLAMGAVSVGMAMTGTVLTNVLATFMIVLLPRMLLSWIVSSFYSMVPFLPQDETVGRILDSSYHIIYNHFSTASYIEYFHEEEAQMFRWIPILYSTILGIVYLTIGKTMFCKRKSENAAKASTNQFCQRLLQTILAFVCSLPAVIKVVEWCIHEEKESGSLPTVCAWLFVGIGVYFLFEFVTTRRWEKVKKAAVGLPVLLGVSTIVCIGLVFGVNSTRGNIPEISEISSVSVLSPMDKEGALYSGDRRMGYTSEDEKAVLQQLKLTSKEAISLVQEQLAYEMKAHQKSKDSYENWCVNLEVLVVIYQGNKELVRNLHFTEKACDKLVDCMAKEAANIHEYVLPMEEIGKEASGGADFFGTLYSFGWDFSKEQIEETYEILREEYLETKPPLTVFMGKEYNKENVFDFLEYLDIKGNEWAVPISVYTPKTLEYVANTGNKIRTDYDFDWFVDYMTKDTVNRGGSLEIILYTGEEEGILHETLSWRGEDIYDIEDERLYELQSILASHEGDAHVSSSENLLCIVYKNIEGYEATGRWYNVTDEEAKKIQELAWIEGKFERYQYWRY